MKTSSTLKFPHDLILTNQKIMRNSFLQYMRGKSTYYVYMYKKITSYAFLIPKLPRYRGVIDFFHINVGIEWKDEETVVNRVQIYCEIINEQKYYNLDSIADKVKNQ